MDPEMTFEQVDADGAISETAHEATEALDNGDTRLSFLKKAGLAGGAVIGGGALLGALTPAGAMAAAGKGRPPAKFGKGDVGILNFALTLEYLESTFYKEALSRAKASGDLKQLIQLIGKDEQQHVEALAGTIKKLGGKPVAEPKFNFEYDDTAGFLKLAQTFEDTGVSAYNGAAPSIQGKDVLASAGAIVQIEGRHAGIIRLLGGLPPAPTAFDPTMTTSQVNAAVAPLIKS